VLIIDDGGSESLQPYIQAWINRFPTIIKCVRTKNNNWGGCFNYAVKHVHTKFLKILDSDDTFFTEHISAYLQYLKHLAKTNVDVVITSFVIDNMKDNVLIKRHYNLKRKITYTNFDRLHFNKVLSMHALTWNLSLLKKIKPLPVKSPYTDQLLVFQTILHSKNVALLPYNIFIYNYKFGDENQSMSWNKTLKNLPKLKQVFHEMLNTSINNLSSKRTRLLVNGIKQLFYLIILIISLDADIYEWQKRKQINHELNLIKTYAKNDNININVKSGYLRIIHRRSISLIMRINKLVLLTTPVGFLKMFRLQYKHNKYEKIPQ
jgi:hypothetical protein